MHPVPKSPSEALKIFRDPASEDWERDYAATMIISLDEALPDLVQMACDAAADEMLQQRAAEALGLAWRERGMLMTANTAGFTPVALAEILAHRSRGPTSHA